MVAAISAGDVASKTMGGAVGCGRVGGELGGAVEEDVSFFVGEPDDLEGAVALDPAADIVVDRLAGRERRRAAALSSAMMR